MNLQLTKIRTGDAALIKELNRSIILNAIRNNCPISRAAVARMSGLNRATVSSIVEELIAGGLVVEAGTGASRGGRRPILLQFNAGAGVIFGVDIGVNYINILLCNLDARVLGRRQLDFSPADRVEGVIFELAAELQKMLEGAPASPLGLVGVGVGVPGFVHHATGTLVFAPNLGWRDLRIGDLLAERFSCPIVLDNEANAGALGEMWFGTARQAASFVYLSVGHGLGAGIVINGELFRGDDGYAGELGHTVIDPGGPPCGCGNRGCWETLASEQALARYAAAAGLVEHALPGAGTVETGRQLVRLAAGGDPRALQVYGWFGEQIGAGIANVVNTFNPSLIVVGNTVAAGWPFMSAAIKKTVQEKALPRLASRIEIVPSSFKQDSCAVGGVAMVFAKLLRLPKLAPAS